MLINGEEQAIVAEPLSSGPIMSIEVTTANGKSVIVEVIGNTLVTYVKSESEKIQGLVVGWNEIITDKGNIILAVGARIKLETGETGSIVKRFEGDILYTAEDLRELNSVRFPSGFSLKDLNSEKIVTPINNTLYISPCNGMVDGIMFSIKKSLAVTIRPGNQYFRVDSVVVRYDSEQNRVYVAAKEGEEASTAEKAKAPDLIERHLGTYEIRLCDVKVTSYMVNLEDDDIIDRRKLLRPNTAKDILFDDSYNIIEVDVEKNVHNALMKIHENSLDEIDNRKAEDLKIVGIIDIERNERIADDTATNERINDLKAEDISYYNTGLMPDDETNTVSPNVQDALDAVAKISIDAGADNKAMRDELEKEKDERIKFDNNIVVIINEVKTSNTNLKTRMDNIEHINNNTNTTINTLNREVGSMKYSITLLDEKINSLETRVATIERRLGL